MWNPFRTRGESRVVDEHFVPGRGTSLRDAIRAGDANAVHHLVRYEWAAQCLSEWPVASLLDLATGSGYGAHRLATSLPSATILGVDYDAGAVEQSRATHRLPNLEFRFGDATRWDATIGPASFDAIVSFDMIEHVSHREVLMEGLVRHLTAGGVLLLSTPISFPETALQPAWVHHRIEYSAASLYDFLRRYFRVVVRPEDPGFPHRDAFDALAEGPVTYLLHMNPVVCREPILVENPYR